MEPLTVAWGFNGVLGVLGIIVWHIFKETRVQAKETQKELQDFKIAAAEKYASREDLRLALRSIEDALVRLEAKVDKLKDRE